MVLAHNIGNINHSNYHTRQQIKDCIEPIGFDGIYANVTNDSQSSNTQVEAYNENN